MSKETKTYKIGNNPEFSIHWSNPDVFKNPNDKSRFFIHGFINDILIYNMPEIGSVIIGDFKMSSIEFKLIKIHRDTDPADRFTGEVIPIKQIMK